MCHFLHYLHPELHHEAFSSVQNLNGWRNHHFSGRILILNHMAREIVILQNLDHPNVVKLEGLATSRMQYSLYLVFDFMVTDLSSRVYMQQLLLDYGVGIDLWSAGCLMAEMFAGRPIMPGRTEISINSLILLIWLSNNIGFSSCVDFPSSSFGLLTMLLALDPSYRGTASSALHNEFFTASPKACDLSGLPVIYKEDEEPDHTSDRKKQRSSKLKQRSRTHNKKDSATEKSKGDSGSSKELLKILASCSVVEGFKVSD
ncbi:hypothetical protein GIB67_039055 [Kingdonia uniflora]|uniref:Protein kinase domain-containing protein n=1 Tax=Kingdonia uniflora TaxID=39325 RepID=A0A7J7LL38_9MAGN|nr:hypothetical protein GIB67_039055 [Kingdonia uniflora]